LHFNAAAATATATATTTATALLLSQHRRQHGGRYLDLRGPGANDAQAAATRSRL